VIEEGIAMSVSFHEVVNTSPFVDTRYTRFCHESAADSRERVQDRAMAQPCDVAKEELRGCRDSEMCWMPGMPARVSEDQR
jgi:hypothetical protein